MTNAQLSGLLGRWPGVESGIKWGQDRVWTVAGKMFCIRLEHAGPETPLSFKAQPERFLELTAQPAFEPAPYLARAGWVLAHPARIPQDTLAVLVHTSYQLVFAKLPKKVQRALDP